jgi:hypothetical protein
MAMQLAQIAHEEATSTNGTETLACGSEGILTDSPTMSWLRVASRKTEMVPLPQSSSTWVNLCGRAGWKTRCRICRQEIDFFITIMN